MRILLAGVTAAGLQLAVFPAAAAADYLWRSATTGVIAQPSPSTPTPPSTTPPIPVDPVDTVSLKISMTGARSVTVGSTLDLRPVVAGAVGKVSYRYIGSLPPGAAFSATTGRISGWALVAGSYPVTVIVTDSTEAPVSLKIVLTVV